MGDSVATHSAVKAVSTVEVKQTRRVKI